MLIIGLYVYLLLFSIYAYGWISTFRPPDPDRPNVLESTSVPATRPALLRVVGVLLAVATCVMVFAAMRGGLTAPRRSERVLTYCTMVGTVLTALWIITERAVLLWTALGVIVLGVAGALLLR